MKQIKLLVLTVFAGLLITSCKSDDDGGDSINSGKLVGEWKLVDETYNGTAEALDVCDLLTKLVMTADTVIQTFYEGANCGLTNSYTSSYSVSGSSLITTDEDGTYEVEITTLNDAILKIKDSDGADVYVYTYLRQ